MEQYHDTLKRLIHEYILLGYRLSSQFPKDERFNMTSQSRRALLSVMLNYVEGFGRVKKKVMLNFYEISYGSLKESMYIFFLAKELGYISQDNFSEIHTRKERISKMLWKAMSGLKKDIKR